MAYAPSIVLFAIGVFVTVVEAIVLHGRTFVVGTITAIVHYGRKQQVELVNFVDSQGHTQGYSWTVLPGDAVGDAVRIAYGANPAIDATLGSFNACFGLGFSFIMVAVLVAGYVWAWRWCLHTFAVRYPVNAPPVAALPTGPAP
jgi:hypothetical protein